MIRGVIRRLGLVTRGEFRLVEAKALALRQRLETTTERLARATAVSEQLQQARRDDAQRYRAGLSELESKHERHTARTADAAAHASKRIGALEEHVRTRQVELEAAAREETRLEQQVAAAMHALQVAREALAVIEVKLDILEGAANVLDSRARTGRATG